MWSVNWKQKLALITLTLLRYPQEDRVAHLLDIRGMGGWIEINTDKQGEQSWHELVSALILPFNEWSQQTCTSSHHRLQFPLHTLNQSVINVTQVFLWLLAVSHHYHVKVQTHAKACEKVTSDLKVRHWFSQSKSASCATYNWLLPI